MTAQNLCPECGEEMGWQDGEYICEPCQARYRKFMYCPTCDAELEKLSACGSTSYFCNTCNELKSRSTARLEFKKL